MEKTIEFISKIVGKLNMSTARCIMPSSRYAPQCQRCAQVAAVPVLPGRTRSLDCFQLCLTLWPVLPAQGPGPLGPCSSISCTPSSFLPNLSHAGWVASGQPLSEASLVQPPSPACCLFCASVVGITELSRLITTLTQNKLTFTL